MPNAPGKRKGGRGKNYDPIEDEALSNAWVTATMEGVGTSQKLEPFWLAVKKLFDSNAEVSALKSAGTIDERDWTGLLSRFGVIARAISRFLKCVRETEVISAHNEANHYLMAMDLYRRQHPSKKAFEFVTPFQILTKCPMFRAKIEEDEEAYSMTALKRPEPCYRCDHCSVAVEKSSVGKNRQGGMKPYKRAKREEASVANSTTILAEAARLSVQVLQAQVLNDLCKTQPLNAKHAEFLELQMEEILVMMRKRAYGRSSLSEREKNRESHLNDRAPSSNVTDGSMEEKIVQASKITIGSLCEVHDSVDDSFDTSDDSDA